MSDFVLMGGLPGSGKSTALARLAPDLVGVRVLDPERLHRALAARLPQRTPYRAYRWLVHTLHYVFVTLHVLAGPYGVRLTGVDRVVVHDPATRTRRRRLLGRAAQWRGWHPAVVYLDVDPALARQGQVVRGRVVGDQSYAGHVERWGRLRGDLVVGAPVEGWRRVVMTDREGAVGALRAELACPPGRSARDRGTVGTRG